MPKDNRPGSAIMIENLKKWKKRRAEGDPVDEGMIRLLEYRIKEQLRKENPAEAALEDLQRKRKKLKKRTTGG